ncbi:hypothetical protein ACPSM1_19445 [Micromonospora chersina]|uniref:hypothetical protein n=1 Tax=Micromonospora chersina TaxID=47854 RepID=UPI003CAFA3EF
MTPLDSLPRTEGPGAWLLLPLAGVSIAAPLHIGKAFITNLTFTEWLLVERRMFTDEYEALVANGYTFAPYALFPVPFEVNAEDAYEALATDRQALSISLRLAGLRGFVEPELLCIYFRAGAGTRRPDAGTNVRWPGPYRQAMYERHFAVVELDAGIAARTEELLPTVYRWLEITGPFDRTCLNLLRQSHVPFVRANDRLLFLFAAVEALLYSWHERIEGASLMRRAELVMSIAGEPQSSKSLLERIRKVRNELAHGEINDDKYAGLVAPLQRVVGVLVTVWLRFCVAVTPPPGNTRRELFNARLAESLRTGEPVEQARRRLFG